MTARKERIAILVGLLAVGACYHPPAEVSPRVGAPIAAPFAQTWTAAVDAFADKNIGIRTIDRSSGLIVADPVTVAPGSTYHPGVLADCGHKMGNYFQPQVAVYNVRVRGDSTSSTVLVTVRWTISIATMGLTQTVVTERVCSSTGSWESRLEQAIKTRAEGR